MRYDAVILGAGASGLWAAMVAAKRGRSVCVVDHGRKAGRKILVAGGGKCNFTNLDMDPHRFVCGNPHFVKSALARFAPWDIIEFLEKRRIGWEERELGRLFCRKSSSEMVSALLKECQSKGVHFRLDQPIDRVEKKDGFSVDLGTSCVRAQNCLVALGGPAWPQAGATNLGHTLASHFGHKIVPAGPALVPFAFPPAWPLAGLTGIALPAKVTAGRKSVTENLLFTHKGLSGPAALQASCHWKKGEALTIDFLPQKELAHLMKEAGGKPFVKSFLSKFLPERLALALLPEKLAQSQLAQLTAKDLSALTNLVHRHRLTPSGTLGMKKAEATRGGVCTSQISSKTMESALAPGLFFSGEVMDVTGTLGGYNLHWAWASGQAAGQAI